MEHWDELWPGGFRFRFDDNVFKHSTDTFLLGDFAEVRRGERVCDLGAGIGLLGLLLLSCLHLSRSSVLQICDSRKLQTPTSELHAGHLHQHLIRFLIRSVVEILVHHGEGFIHQIVGKTELHFTHFTRIPLSPSPSCSWP